MVLVCKIINQRCNINTYHHNLIKNKEIALIKIINENARNNKLNKDSNENNLTKIHYENIEEITEDIDIVLNPINITIRKEKFIIGLHIK